MSKGRRHVRPFGDRYVLPYFRFLVHWDLFTIPVFYIVVVFIKTWLNTASAFTAILFDPVWTGHSDYPLPGQNGPCRVSRR